MYESECRARNGALNLYEFAYEKQEKALAENAALRSNCRWLALAVVVQFVALVLIGIWWWGQNG